MEGLEAKGIVGPYALLGVGLAVRPGEWVALLGPNGSGKSTLLRVMAGLLRPRAGGVFLEGKPLRAYGSYARGRLLAYLPQGGPYPEGLLVEEVVRLGRLPHLGLWGREVREDVEAVEWALEVTGASRFRGRYLGSLSGGERQRVLLARALAAVDDRLKPALVVQLAEIGGEGVAETLVRLLERRGGFSREVREELVVRIVLALRNFTDKDSAAAIARLVKEQADAPWSERIVPIAEEALRVIEPKLRHERQKMASMHEETTFADDPGEMVKAASLIRPFEEEIAALIRKGDLDIACGKIFSRCVTAARDKDFITAEKLRDRLLQINPMALAEVLQAGEIIEEERGTSITDHHLTIWADLHGRMSTAEFTALYQAMRPERYRVGEAIVRRGETDPCLYFINSGSVGTYCHDGAQENFLKRMQPGDILGVDQFFSASVWTITLKALSDVRVHVLDRRALADLQPAHAEIEPKLQGCCRKFDIVPELVRMAGSDRRDHPRFRLSMTIDAMLLDRYGHPGKGTFKGEMTDVSRGGFAVAIRMPNRNSASLLLGRQVVTELGPIEGRLLQCTGMIVGVTSRIAAEQDLVIHIKLFNKLEQTVVTEIVSVSHRTTGR